MIKVFTLSLITCIGVTHAREPSVENIDYENPEKYLELHKSLGTSESINTLAAELKSDADLETIQNILEWMDDNLKHDPNLARSWRNCNDVLKDASYLGCADQGIFCGTLLKKAGIPTIWVKTMDITWIRDFKRNQPFTTWSGHVFLEVYVDNCWMLLDPGGKRIYKNYSPKALILPGGRYAYDKGDTPKMMVMSLQWDQWKKQTTDYFTKFDESLLPVDDTQSVLLKPFQAFIIGNAPHYKKLSIMAKEQGFTVTKAFNSDYDYYLPLCKGHLLLIETHNGKPIIAQNILEKHFPRAFEALNTPDKTTRHHATTIVFFDFKDPLKPLPIKADNQAK